MVYFFIHTPKTSGTTFMEVLRRDSKNQIGFFYPMNKEMDDFEFRIKEGPHYHFANTPDWQKYNYIGGHFTFGIHEIFKSDNFKYIGVFREPVNHYLSYYKAFLRMPDAYKETVIPGENKSIEKLLELDFTHNLQTFFLSGLSMQQIREDKEKALQIAIDNVDKYFEGVYPTHFFDEGLVYFKHKIGLRPQYYLKKNVAANALPQAVSQQTIEIIKKVNDLDIRLCENLNQRFFDSFKSIPLAGWQVMWFKFMNRLNAPKT